MTALARFDALTKRYGSATVVDGLTLTVPEGSVIGLLGPNGAGKTTSIKMLLGLAKASSGTVELLGHAPGSAGFPGAVRQVGALIEGPALFARASARDNMRIEAAARGIRHADARIAELLELVGLTGAASKDAGQFSLGMKQRLGLALALLPQPRLVVLDEPTNGLDPAGIVEIRELIKRLPERGTTVLVSSHLLAEVQLMCHRAAIIHHGRLVAEGSIDELLAGYGGGGFLVRVPDPAQATHVLAQAQLQAATTNDGRIAISNATDGAQITRALADAGIYLSELTAQTVSLEDVFLSLTDDHVEA